MKLSWKRHRVRCRHPFGTAHGTVAEKEALIVSLAHEGVVGLGEAAPTSLYGQSLESAEAALSKMAEPLGNDPFCIDAIVNRLTERFDDQRAAVAAVDAALHDWVGKRLGVPIWRLLGLDRSQTPLTSFTIGIDQVDRIRQKVREAAEYPILKVKVGTPNDEQILTAIRTEAPDKVVRVDANCGWTPENAAARMRMVARFRIEFVEQPIPPGNPQQFKRLHEAKILPIVVDESCVRPRDIAPLAGCVDGINIKLCKCGGIREGLRMIHIARGLGLKVMLGCMVETSVGIAAAAQLAPLADFIDLDGHLLLADDPFTGLGGAGGRLDLSLRPGLGVKPVRQI